MSWSAVKVHDKMWASLSNRVCLISISLLHAVYAIWLYHKNKETLFFHVTGCVLRSSLSWPAGGDLSERHPGEFASVSAIDHVPLAGRHLWRRHRYFCYLYSGCCCIWRCSTKVLMRVFFQPFTFIWISSRRCMNLMAPSWCTGMHWTVQKHLQVNSHKPFFSTHADNQILTYLNYLHENLICHRHTLFFSQEICQCTWSILMTQT